MAVDGDAGLEGYFQEYDHDLPPEERLRFVRNEEPPPFDPSRAPALDWPAERLAKAHRAYAMEYVRSALPASISSAPKPPTSWPAVPLGLSACRFTPKPPRRWG